MKFTLSWLKEYLNTESNLSEICDNLTDIGLEIEEVVDKSESLAAFSVAKIIEANPHPQADKLQICKVDVGAKDSLQIICGAANARVGLKVIYAPINSIIPTNNLKIKKSAIRGIDSFGMLCSASELGLGEDSEGIVEIAQDVAIGSKITDIYGLDDAIIDINITPNRGDCLGVYGVARDLSAAGVGVLKDLSIAKPKTSFNSKVKVQIDKKSIGECPYFALRYIKNVTNKESPKWLQDRLIDIGVNPISAAVDITNYVMYSFGQPLHAYDADKIEGDIVVRNAQNENFTSLKDLEYSLSKNELVIADQKKIISLAGIIGGANSSCEINTSNIVLEAAFFDADKIAATGRDLNILSDARYRFERKTDPLMVNNALDFATNLIIEICGGEVSEISFDGSSSLKKRTIDFSLNKVTSLLGIEIDKKEILDIFSRLNLEILAEKDDVLTIQIPSFRNDLTIDQDLVEEIIRIYGYNKIKSTALPITGSSNISKTLSKIEILRHNLGNTGFSEVISWSFVSSKVASLFSEIQPSLLIDNPISSDMGYMRPSLIPGLVLSAQKNQLRNFDNLAFFEIGKIFNNVDAKGQKQMVAGLRIGKNKERSHYADERNFDYLDVKKDLFHSLEILGINSRSLSINIDNLPTYYHPYRSAKVTLGKNIIGYFGELHPLIAKKLDVKGRVNIFEICFDDIRVNAKIKAPKAFIANDLQSVKRDFAFTLDQDIKIGDLLEKVARINPELINQVNLFDLYVGDKIAKGKKSVAFSIKIQPKIKTLTSEEINQISDNVINLVTNNFKGELRS